MAHRAPVKRDCQTGAVTHSAAGAVERTRSKRCRELLTSLRAQQRSPIERGHKQQAVLFVDGQQAQWLALQTAGQPRSTAGTNFVPCNKLKRPHASNSGPTSTQLQATCSQTSPTDVTTYVLGSRKARAGDGFMIRPAGMTLLKFISWKPWKRSEAKNPERSALESGLGLPRSKNRGAVAAEDAACFAGNRSVMLS